MTLPPALLEEIGRVFASQSLSSAIQGIRPVSGGDINQAGQITTDDGLFFVKWLKGAAPGFFQAEAHGLALLTDAHALRVPAVIGAGIASAIDVSFLILEWIDTRGGRSTNSAEQLGRGLAQLHQTEAEHYGLDHDNFIGRLPQPNIWVDSWIDFYAEYRLGAQQKIALSKNRMPPKRTQNLNYVIAHLDRWLDESFVRPSLLHGDLWSGNWTVASDGEPVILDPATYFGDREADLAMTTLFGGFPSVFYEAYNEVYPLNPGWEAREPLYHLYHLLSHLNHFGGGYGASVDRILTRYAG